MASKKRKHSSRKPRKPANQTTQTVSPCNNKESKTDIVPIRNPRPTEQTNKVPTITYPNEPSSIPSRDISKISRLHVAALRNQILLAQGAGLLLLVSVAILFSEDYIKHTFCWIGLISLSTTFYFGAVYFDRTRRNILTLSPAQRLERYRGCFGILVSFDTFILLAAIGLSGGIKSSHLIFVLTLIPATVGYIRGGGKTLICTSFVIIVIIFFEVLGSSLGMPSLMPSSHCSIVVQKLVSVVGINLNKINASENTRFPIAYGFGLIVAVVLSALQARYASSEGIPSQITLNATQFLSPIIKNEDSIHDIISCVETSFRKSSRIIGLTNQPDLHMSEVHPLKDVVFQACILAVPGIKRGEPKLARRAAKMVFAAHWLDDMFDYLGFGNQTENGFSQRINIQTAPLDQIANYFHPYGLKRIIKFIRSAGVFDYSNDRWLDGIESGITRVILAGIIQCDNKQLHQMAKYRLRMEVDKFIRDGYLKKQLDNANTAFLWSISKTAMPLVVGMYWAQHQIESIEHRSFILDAIFMPLLLWHNFEEEFKREKLSNSGFDGDGLQNEIEKAVETCVKIVEPQLNLVSQWNSLWDSFKDVLKLVYHGYGSNLPKDSIYADYHSILQELME